VLDQKGMLRVVGLPEPCMASHFDGLPFPQFILGGRPRKVFCLHFYWLHSSNHRRSLVHWTQSKCFHRTRLESIYSGSKELESMTMKANRQSMQRKDFSCFEFLLLRGKRLRTSKSDQCLSRSKCNHCT
jgi:hypothetical protein